MKSTIAKKTEGYGYKYTELADINKYCETNGIRYYQEIETSEINQEDYIITYLIQNGETTKHRGCKIVDAVLSGIKNPVQEYGSSLTYCRRYSLLMALGLATEDDDGASLTITKEPTLEDAENFKIDFGKHKGKLLKDLLEEDKQYVQWMLNNKSNDYFKKCYKLLSGEVLPTEQEQDERIKLMSEINELERELNVDHDEVLSRLNVDSLSQLTNTQLLKCKSDLEKVANVNS